MGTLKEDLEEGSEWLVKAFAADGIVLDYSIDSFIKIDKFFNKHTINGEAKKGGRLANNLGAILFSIAGYIGETIIHNVPGSIWVTNDDEPDGELTTTIHLPNGIIISPAQRVMKRFKNGIEDSIYVYGFEATKEFTGNTFNESYWKITAPKSWWKFW